MQILMNIGNVGNCIAVCHGAAVTALQAVASSMAELQKHRMGMHA